jgi:hypothetical protein
MIIVNCKKRLPWIVKKIIAYNSSSSLYQMDLLFFVTFMVVKQALPSCEMLKCNSINEKNSLYDYDIN